LPVGPVGWLPGGDGWRVGREGAEVVPGALEGAFAHAGCEAQDDLSGPVQDAGDQADELAAEAFAVGAATGGGGAGEGLQLE
jgi:hypothetical protein